MLSLPDLNLSLLVRTDFGNEDAWQRVCAEAVQQSSEGFQAYVAPHSDPAFHGAEWQAVQAAVPENDHGASVLFIADQETLASPEAPILVVGLGFDRDEPVFRCIPAELWGVDNNLNIRNMDWADFYDATDEALVFRGF